MNAFGDSSLFDVEVSRGGSGIGVRARPPGTRAVYDPAASGRAARGSGTAASRTCSSSSPDEANLRPEIGRHVGAKAQVVIEPSFERVAALIRACAVFRTND
ncbi:MAG TPA: hypothetical protein VKE49_13210, partial [Myxococcaceae bacterium]|nr:hypothetical protein [Myxococcaceae bacterium]